MSATNPFVRNLMGEQRKRAIGALMNHIEREVYPLLDDRQKRALRDRVIGAITQYHDTALDVLKASVDDGTSIINHDALVMLSRMDGNLRELARQVSDG